jgi:hypothetical protein
MGVKLGLSHCREECGLKVFESRMLRRISGPKIDEVTWEWRRLHNDELYDLYSFCSLSYDRSVASSKANSPQDAI